MPRYQSDRREESSKPTHIPTTEALKPRPFAQPSASEDQALDMSNLEQQPVHFSAGPSGSGAMPLQAKLTIGAPNDPYEQEADRVAAQVVEKINLPQVAQSHPQQAVQREVAPEEEEVQMKPLLQREAAPEEEEELQAKLESIPSLSQRPRISDLQLKSLSSTVQREAMEEEGDVLLKRTKEHIAGGDASADLESAINSARGHGQPLEPTLQKQMGQAMGADFSGVTVHTDGTANQLSQSIQAKAFTTGKDIFFKGGEYNPGSRDGQELIAHELTHVVQQNTGTLHMARDENKFKSEQEGSAAMIGLQKYSNEILQRQKSGDNKQAKPTFEEVMSNKVLKARFRAFSAKQHCEENIDFISIVTVFQRSPTLELRKIIYDKFIAGDKQVNLNAVNRATIDFYCQHDKIFPSTFDDAKLEIENMIKRDSFQRFLLDEFR